MSGSENWKAAITDHRKSVLSTLDQHFERAVLVIVLSLIIILISQEVVRRYVFDASTAWAQQVAIFLYVFASWIGAAYAVRLRIHLQMSFVQDSLPNKLRIATITFGNALFLVLLAVITYYAADIALLQYELGRSLVGVDVPSYWFYGMTPIATTILAIRVIQTMYEDVTTYLESGEIIESESIFMHED